MGLFSKDLKYNETNVKNGKDAIENSKKRVENSVENIQKQLNIINNSRGFSEVFEPLTIAPFQTEHNNCIAYVDSLTRSIKSMVDAIDDYKRSSGWKKFGGSALMAISKIFEGIGSFGEQIMDGAATIVGFATCWGADDGYAQGLSKFIEKDWVGDAFEDFYTNEELGWGQWIDKKSNFSHTSGTASIFKVTGEIAPYIAITVATHGAGAPALEAAMATLSTTGRTNQANLKQQHSDQLASGVDEKNIKYDFYAAATPAIGAGLVDGAIAYTVNKATQAMSARHALKSGGKIADKADDAARAVSQNSDDFVDAAEKLAKAENELNAANRAGASVDELGRLEEARDAAKHAFTELGGKADDVIGKSKEISKAESVLKEAEKKWKLFEEGEAYSPYSAVAEEADKARDAYQKALKGYRTTLENAAGSAKGTLRSTANSADDTLSAVEKAKKKYEEAKYAYESAKRNPNAGYTMTNNLKKTAKAAKADYKVAIGGNAVNRTEAALESTKAYQAVDNFANKVPFVKNVINPEKTGIYSVARGATVLGGTYSAFKEPISQRINEISGQVENPLFATDYKMKDVYKENGGAFGNSNTIPQIDGTSGNSTGGSTGGGSTGGGSTGGGSTGGGSTGGGSTGGGSTGGRSTGGGSTGGRSTGGGYSGGGSTGGGYSGGGSTGGGYSGGGSTGGGYSGNYTGGTVTPATPATLTTQLKQDDAITDATLKTVPSVKTTPSAGTTPSIIPSTDSTPSVTPIAAVPAASTGGGYSDYGTTQHSGGGYYSGGYVSDVTNADAADTSTLTPLDEALLDYNTTSIDEIVKGSKYTKIPTSSKPISATTTSSGSGSSAVIPIAAGLSAAAAAGIGAKAYMDRKKNNDTEDDDDEFDTEEWSEDESYSDSYDDSSDTEAYLDSDDDYSYQESEEKYGARTNDELADMQ